MIKINCKILDQVPEDWRREDELKSIFCGQEMTNFLLQLDCWAGDLWPINKKYQRLRANLIWGKLIDWYFPGDFFPRKMEMIGLLQGAYSFSQPCSLIFHSLCLPSHQGRLFLSSNKINAKSLTSSVSILHAFSWRETVYLGFYTVFTSQKYGSLLSFFMQSVDSDFCLSVKAKYE